MILARRLPAALLIRRGAWVALALATSLILVACPGSEEATVVAPTEVFATPTAELAMPGVTDNSILFGQSAAFTGPAGELGSGMRLGIQAAFDEANRRGGVNGRLLELTSVDDQYEPEMAIANTIHLINEEEVFALIGSVGTPTSRSTVPLIENAGVPYIAPFTGANFLRDAKLNSVVNLRASYFQETAEMVARLVEDIGIQRIAVLHQDDSFGRAGYQGVILALAQRDMEPVSIGVYPRNTTAIKTALLDLRQGEPEAVILVGAHEPVATLITWAQEIGMDPVFMTISFVGTNVLAQELGPRGAGVYITQVVPYPMDDTIPVVRRYRNALSEYDPEAVPGFVSFEGYLAGRLAIAGLEGCGREVDRDCFLESLRGADVIDIDGFQLRYGRGDNQGSDTVFLTVIGEDGLIYPVTSLLQEKDGEQ